MVKKYPNVIYLILGKTHPYIYEKSGDSYKHSLLQLVNKLGMENHVVFHNYFVKVETLIQYIQTSKIYAIPYLKKEQITSGTLSYALGAGAAVVSTPFLHAEELLADGRGQLVPFNNPAEMAKEINNLLSNDQKREMMRFKGYQFSRSMTWKEVAKRHLELVTEIKERKPLENL